MSVQCKDGESQSQSEEKVYDVSYGILGMDVKLFT